MVVPWTTRRRFAADSPLEEPQHRRDGASLGSAPFPADCARRARRPRSREGHPGALAGTRRVSRQARIEGEDADRTRSRPTTSRSSSRCSTRQAVMPRLLPAARGSCSCPCGDHRGRRRQPGRNRGARTRQRLRPRCRACRCAGGRRQSTRGVAEARSPLLCVLHADTILPDDALTVIRRTLANPRDGPRGDFTPLIAGAETVRWGTTFHDWIKTWYAPVIFRPISFSGAAASCSVTTPCSSGAPTSWPSAAAMKR